MLPASTLELKTMIFAKCLPSRSLSGLPADGLLTIATQDARVENTNKKRRR